MNILAIPLFVVAFVALCQSFRHQGFMRLVVISVALVLFYGSMVCIHVVPV